MNKYLSPIACALILVLLSPYSKAVEPVTAAIFFGVIKVVADSSDDSLEKTREKLVDAYEENRRIRDEYAKSQTETNKLNEALVELRIANEMMERHNENKEQRIKDYQQQIEEIKAVLNAHATGSRINLN